MERGRRGESASTKTRVSTSEGRGGRAFVSPRPAASSRRSPPLLARIAGAQSSPLPAPTLDTESRPFLEWPAPFLWAASTSRLPPSGRAATGRAVARDAPARDAHAMCAVRRVPNIGVGRRGKRWERDERKPRGESVSLTPRFSPSLRSLFPPPAPPSLGRPGPDRGRTEPLSPTPHTHRAAGRTPPSLPRVSDTPLPAQPSQHTTSCRPPRRRRYVCVYAACLEPRLGAEGAGVRGYDARAGPRRHPMGRREAWGWCFFLHPPCPPASLPATVRGKVKAACGWWKQEAGARAVRPRAQAFGFYANRGVKVCVLSAASHPLPPPRRLPTPGLEWHGCRPSVLGVSGAGWALARARGGGLGNRALAKNTKTGGGGRPPTRTLSDTTGRRSHPPLPSLPSLPTVQDRAVQAPGHGGPVVRWCVVCVCAVGWEGERGEGGHTTTPTFFPPSFPTLHRKNVESVGGRHPRDQQPQRVRPVVRGAVPVSV